jgi:hypothetical protein
MEERSGERKQQGKGVKESEELSHEAEKEQNRAAFEEAMHDIDDDVELSTQSPNDDLDEGETARLGEDRTDLV